jgi:hypothetical protein
MHGTPAAAWLSLASNPDHCALVLANCIRQTSVSEAGRALDWDNLHSTFGAVLHEHTCDGP